jgi:hypothetical protein
MTFSEARPLPQLPIHLYVYVDKVAMNMEFDDLIMFGLPKSECGEFALNCPVLSCFRVRLGKSESAGANCGCLIP